MLIKVECAALNPCDTYLLAGKYEGEFAYPLIPGVESAGTVVSSGGGFMGWTLVGKRVAFGLRFKISGPHLVDGTYAEYIVLGAGECIPLDNNTTFEKAAGTFVNPLTSVALLDRCKSYKARAVIQTAAASQLGRMMIRLFRDNRIPVINIVRREE